MPQLLSRLRGGPTLNRRSVRQAPERGVYVLYENGVPIYVGRSNRVGSRLLEHGRPSSNHNTAPFAFNLAKEAVAQQGIEVEARQRSQIENNPIFKGLFLAAKQRVGEKDIKVVEISDPIEQTLFEVYAALALGTTPYNNFETH